MKKKLLAAIGLTQILILCACGAGDGTAVTPQTPAQEEVSKSTDGKEDTAAAATEEEKTDAQNTADASATEAQAETPAEQPAWKDAYLTILKEERAKIPENATIGSEESAEWVDTYWLYDIDKDGTPELILRRGDCEAAYHGEVYTYKDDAVKQVAKDLGLGHTTLQTVPGENGIIFYWGHMGYAGCSRTTMTENGLEDELLFEDDLNERMQAGEEDAWYKPASDVVPGSYYLMSYDKNNDLPILVYETIEAEQAGKQAGGGTADAAYPNNDTKFFDKLMEGTEVLQAVPADTYVKNPGLVPFSELLKTETIYQYGEGPLSVTDKVDVDLNGDGQLERVVYLDTKDSEASEGRGHEYRIVLSEKDGQIYAYIGWLASEKEITKDGTFTFADEYNSGYAMRMLFDRDACVFYSIAPKG